VGLLLARNTIPVVSRLSVSRASKIKNEESLCGYILARASNDDDFLKLFRLVRFELMSPNWLTERAMLALRYVTRCFERSAIRRHGTLERPIHGTWSSESIA
jgi:hypothetical protein